MKRNLNLKLIHRYLAGECTKEEERKVLRWLETDPANRQKMDALSRIWEVEPRKELDSDTRLAWKRLEKQLDQRDYRPFDTTKRTRQRQSIPYLTYKTRSGYNSVWLRLAAVIVLAGMLSLFFIEFIGSGSDMPGEVDMREAVAERGKRSEVTFSDGSRVVLNSGSRIRFPDRFAFGTREVYLEGEAYFEVVHRPGVTFTVQTSNARVTVLGTKFNVKARPENQEAKVTVAQGKVSVRSYDEANTTGISEVILTGGQTTIVKRGQAPIPPQPVDVSKYLSWLRGDFVFDQEPFSEVLREWERRFDVDFMVEDSTLFSVLFTGEFRNESLEEMLRLASRSLEFTYHRNDQTITISNQ